MCPTYKNSRISPTDTFIEYFPSKSVCAPLDVPLTITAAPGSGKPSSAVVTNPVTIFSFKMDCAIFPLILGVFKESIFTVLGLPCARISWEPNVIKAKTPLATKDR